MTDVALVQLDDGLPIPSFQRDGDAAVDLYARTDVVIDPAGGRAVVPTGIAIALPFDRAGLVLPRSGLAARHGITCLNAPGLIDSGFRGEIQVILVNTDPSAAYSVTRGDRIAQLLVMERSITRFVVVDELPESDRGTGGFGHTGK